MLKTDVVIIGAGAVGSALAREFSKYRLDVTVIEKNEDLLSWICSILLVHSH